MKNNCAYWGENRIDEMFLDVGCTLGYCDCKASRKCENFEAVRVVKA